MNQEPPLEAWYVVEVDVARDRDNPLYASIRGPFPTKEAAENERDEQQAAWDSALEESDGEDPYDFKGWDIVPKTITDHQLDQLGREDEESHRIKQEAADAVSAALLADEGIGPMADESTRD